MSVRVSILIPTFRRPDALRNAVESVFSQSGIDFEACELLVVDNDPEASARQIGNDLLARAPLAMKYIHEPDAGVANARNTGIENASGRLIAFLDDDETAAPDWLYELIRVYQRLKTAVVFGPVKTALPEHVARHRTYFEAFFERSGPSKDQMIQEPYGCGNSLLDLDQLPNTDKLFNPEMNEIGGEDDFLFEQVRRAGGKFGWAASAVVFEHPPASRVNLKYTLRRAFSYGQGPSATAALNGKPNLLKVAMWMTIGLVQFLCFGPIGTIAYLVAPDASARLLDRAAQGLGKILWFGPFEQGFYGRAAL